MTYFYHLSKKIELSQYLKVKKQYSPQKNEKSLIEPERTALEVKNTITQVHFDMQGWYESYEIRFNNGVSNL